MLNAPGWGMRAGGEDIAGRVEVVGGVRPGPRAIAALARLLRSVDGVQEKKQPGKDLPAVEGVAVNPPYRK